MRKWKAVCILVLAALLLMLPALSACATAADTAVIDGMDASRVHLRQEANQAAASLGLFFTGTEVTLLDTSNEEWAQVEIGSQRGYMMKKYLRIGADPRLATNRQPLGVPGNSNEEAPVWYTLPATGQPDGNLTQAAVLTILGETADGYYYAQAANLHFYVASDAVWITGEDAMPAVRASRLLGQVVADYLPYLDAISGQEMLLSQYNPYVDGLTYRIGRYAIADLDRDGVQEVAVEVLVEEYPFCYLLLDERNGKVYGYEIPARGFMELKADGTARWNYGEGIFGFGWRDDWNGDSAAGTIALCDTVDGQSVYIVNGEPVTLEAFQEADWQQSIKPNAVWYWPTEDNLAMLFE